MIEYSWNIVFESFASLKVMEEAFHSNTRTGTLGMFVRAITALSLICDNYMQQASLSGRTEFEKLAHWMCDLMILG